jgi:ferredoxin
MASKKISVDQDICIGCTTCAAMCPLYFEMNDGGKAQPVIDEAVNSDDFELIDDAEKSCPVDAISVKDSENK